MRTYTVEYRGEWWIDVEAESAPEAVIKANQSSRWSNYGNLHTDMFEVFEEEVEQ